jgi:hypothetical protein
MKYRPPEIFLGVFLAVAIFAMGMLFASSIFQPNVKPEVEAQKHSEVSKASTDERIADYTWWLAVLTGGLVLVAFGQGVFIARSDKTARIAANAADLSARAAVAIELPIIRANLSKLIYGWSKDGEPDNPRIDWCCITYLNFYNGGRTKAFPIEVRCGWVVGSKLPDVPLYTNAKALPINCVFEPNNSEEPDQVRINDFGLKIAPGLYEELRSNAVSLWFYCSIVYFDFMQTRHEVGFCWKRYEMIGSGGFLADPTPAYNQKT